MAVWVTGFYFSIGSILTNFAPCYLFSGESSITVHNSDSTSVG
jgi:hypothetical protein